MALSGKVWQFGDDINTDLIMPQVTFLLPLEEQVKHVFQANRPGWIDLVQEGDFIVAGRNFGTGSSRPGAQLLRSLGITCLIAESINGLFFRNSVNFGLYPIQCPGAATAFAEGDQAEVKPEIGQVKNLRTGQVLYGEKLPEFLLNIIRSGGIIPMLKQQGFME